ncbi:hypothetical protein BQ8420_17120 [Nocardiopsis sp. JB363]|nr:hypothetical protein BQ8420_17120 [Nocardiopsis sp. JB363]
MDTPRPDLASPRASVSVRCSASRPRRRGPGGSVYMCATCHTVAQRDPVPAGSTRHTGRFTDPRTESHAAPRTGGSRERKRASRRGLGGLGTLAPPVVPSLRLEEVGGLPPPPGSPPRTA